MLGHWLPQRRSSDSHPLAQGKPRVDEQCFVTGADLVIDGGFLAR
jgi:hypothetical protein